MTSEKDYYEILGVLRSAKLVEITAAYHRLVHKWHPDVGATDPDSQSMCKLINEAYEVLSDEQKRRAYDRQKRSGWRVGSSGASSEISFVAPAKPFVSDTEAASTDGASPNDIVVELPIAPEEALYGGPCEFILDASDRCGGCDGHGRIAADLCELCNGQKTIRVRRSLQLVLPRRAQTGMVLRVVGHGKQSAQFPGDLLVKLRIQPCW